MTAIAVDLVWYMCRLPFFHHLGKCFRFFAIAIHLFHFKFFRFDNTIDNMFNTFSATAFPIVQILCGKKLVEKCLKRRKKKNKISNQLINSNRREKKKTPEELKSNENNQITRKMMLISISIRFDFHHD